MNLLDRAIAYVSPVRGALRTAARSRIEALRRYDGAASGRRTDSWRTCGTSANAEAVNNNAMVVLRDRHRDLARNNPWVARAVQAIVGNTVGFGITAKVGGTKAQQAAWKAWAGTTACDADGRHDLAGLQALILATVVVGGECLVRRRWRRPEDGLPVPMQLQVLEGDQLDHTKDESLSGGGWITQGVQFSAFGAREGYWLFQTHPGDNGGWRNTESVFVPAADVAHIYRCDRPGQVRGIAWGAPAMITLRDLDDFEDAFLFRQKIANCQVGVFTGREGGAAGLAATTCPAPSESFEPGRFEYAPEGMDVKFNSPPIPGEYGPYVRDVLLRVAACYGITFQALTGDLTSVNFSSGRMGWLEMQRNIDSWRWHMLIPQGCDRIGGWFNDALNLTPGNAARRPLTFEWTPPRREMIDPAKEIAAAIDGVRSGVIPLQDIHRQNGEDSEDVLRKFKEDADRIKQLGLVFDTTPNATGPKEIDA